MSPEVGEQLMLWTVRASVACYVIALWHWLFPAMETGVDRIYRRFWFASWLLCLTHVICAFHFRHHWVHAVAIEHTAATTEQVVGLRWGGGLYINYIFLSCWGISATSSLWSAGTRSGLGRWLDVGLHAFAAFMMFNATAVFGPTWWWIPTLAVTVGISLHWWRRRGRSAGSLTS